jgi:hypothetical protein
VKGRAQAAQILVGRFAFFMNRGIGDSQAKVTPVGALANPA